MLIILDRDGVINYDSPNYIRSPEEWEPIPGSLEAIARLSKDHPCVVCTNQSGIGRGYYTEATLTAIHKKMNEAIIQYGGQLAKIYYCPHHPDDGCNCRKPATGLYEQALKDFNIDSSQAHVIGDSWRDLEAAIQLGINASLVLTGNGKKTATLHHDALNTHQIKIFENLYARTTDLQ